MFDQAVFEDRPAPFRRLFIAGIFVLMLVAAAAVLWRTTGWMPL